MKTWALLAGVVAMPFAATAQHNHAEMHQTTETASPTEPGQGGFAAVAEIVALLRADPETDWDRVDLDGLVRHLRDMDSLVTEVEVSQSKIPDGIEVTISRDAPGAASAWVMVPAHAGMLASETGWTSDVDVAEDQLIWRVTSAEDAAVVQGLGFFGLMATGAHHQMHHLAIAKGEMPH